MYRNLLLLMLVLGMVSCNSGETEHDELEPTPQSQNISFTGSINPMSRATANTFESGDEISVFAIEKTVSNTLGHLQSKNYADNVKYSYSDGYFASLSPIEPSPAGNSLFFRAVYPYVANTAASFVFSVKTDQYTGDAYTLSDLMTAETTATTELTPELVFNHRLSNIIFNFTFEAKPSGNEELYVNNVKVQTAVNLNDNTYQASGSMQNVRAASNGTNSYRVILPPQTIPTNTTLLTLKVGEKEYTWYTENDFVWKSGKQYEYDLTVKKSGEIKFTASINPWNPNKDIEDIIPSDILNKVKQYVPIHQGVTPPNVEGVYYLDPMETVYCEDELSGGYKPGVKVISELMRFSNQNNVYLTIDYDAKTANGSTESGRGSFISGSGNKFTIYFDAKGYTPTESGSIFHRTALIISGTKVDKGIQDLRYAFVMVEKGEDPKHELMDVGVFRVFKDSDELASASSWNIFSKTKSVDSLHTLYENIEKNYKNR